MPCWGMCPGVWFPRSLFQRQFGSKFPLAAVRSWSPWSLTKWAGSSCSPGQSHVTAYICLSGALRLPRERCSAATQHSARPGTGQFLTVEGALFVCFRSVGKLLTEDTNTLGWWSPHHGEGLVNMEEKILLWWEENEILVLSRLFYTVACLASIGLKGKAEFMLFHLHTFWKAMFEPKESNWSWWSGIKGHRHCVLSSLISLGTYSRQLYFQLIWREMIRHREWNKTYAFVYGSVSQLVCVSPVMH